MKVKIYALINPITGIPFYVGATVNKLNERLSGHRNCGDGNKTKHQYGFRRRGLIKQVEAMGLKVEIRLLEEVPFAMASKAEEKHYLELINQGFELIQSPTRFYYTESKS